MVNENVNLTSKELLEVFVFKSTEIRILSV